MMAHVIVIHLCRINYADFGHEILGSFHFFFDYFAGKPSAHGHGHRIGNANNGQDTPGNVVVPAHSDVIAAQGGTGPGPVRGEGGAARTSGYLAPGGGGRYNEWRRSDGRPKMDLAQAFRLSGSGYSKPPYNANDDGSRPSYDSRTPITASSPDRMNYSRPMRGGGIAEETGGQGGNGGEYPLRLLNQKR
jgi:hypothetical protein